MVSSGSWTAAIRVASLAYRSQVSGSVTSPNFSLGTSSAAYVSRAAPMKHSLPGKVIGEATSGDAVFVVTLLKDTPRLADNGRSYLTVSPRTPYNRIILPLMSLSATITRKGKTVFNGPLRSVISPMLKYHYGTQIEPLKSGDHLTIAIQAPPQTARHDGYETAFVNMANIQVTL